MSLTSVTGRLSQVIDQVTPATASQQPFVMSFLLNKTTHLIHVVLL